MKAALFKAGVVLLCVAGVAAGTNAEGKAFLEENGKKDGVITLASGMQYKVLRKGSGTDHPTVDSPCECHYKGTLIDGTKFDSSYDRGSPTTFAPNQVIKGWTEAMQLMVEGDKWEMYIPSELGYGDSGSPPKIKGGDVLVFVMEIIKIKGGKKPAITCEPVSGDGCNDKEKKYVEKATKKFGGDKEKLNAEAARLRKMQGGKMKPELQQWLARRLHIVTKLADAKDEL
jgi:FKBP-type peptidyl-prolyl cis-trans isomerase FklB|eukprot:g1788.t1